MAEVKKQTVRDMLHQMRELLDGIEESQVDGHVPQIRVEIDFAEIGYEANAFINNVKVLGSCRDFSGKYEVPDLQQEFLEAFGKMLKEFWKTR